jgi:hypothetical protein
MYTTKTAIDLCHFNVRLYIKADRFPFMMPQIKKENKINFKEVIVSALTYLIQIKPFN